MTADEEAPLSPIRAAAAAAAAPFRRSNTTSSSASISPTQRSSNTRARGRRHSTMAEGRAQRVQVDLMDLSVPNFAAGSDLEGTAPPPVAPGLSTSRESISATADMINLLSTFQANSMNASYRDNHHQHFSASTRRASNIMPSSWMQRQSSLNNMGSSSDLGGAEINLMDMSAPAHFHSGPRRGSGGNRRGSTTSYGDAITGAATNVVNMISDTVAGSSTNSTVSMADILKQRRAFQRSGTVESDDIKNTQELMHLRASVAEKNVQIEELTRALQEANDTIQEETQSNIDLEFGSSDEDDSDGDDQERNALNEQSELRQSMRNRMSSATFSSQEPYIPSAWHTPEEYRQQHALMEAKLVTAISNQEATQQFLKEKELQIASLQREIQRQIDTEQELRNQLHAMQTEQAHQIQTLKETSLKALEDEQASSEKQLKKQAKQFQKRAEKAVAILEEIHAKDKEEMMEASQQTINELQCKLQMQALELEALKGTNNKGKNGVVVATNQNGTSLQLALVESKLQAQEQEMQQQDQLAQRKLAELEQKLQKQQQQLQHKDQQSSQYQSKLKEQGQTLEALQKSNTEAKQQQAVLEERLQTTSQELEILKKQQQQNLPTSVPPIAVPIPPSPTATSMGERIRERMQEQARMLDKMRQSRPELSIEL